MQAFVPAAGLGTRLRPLTDKKPKALIEIGGEALLSHTINRLTQIGIDYIVVNIHHYGEQIIEYIAKRRWDAEIRISDEREQLKDTGGGLKQAESLFRRGETVLIHNVDVIANFDIRTMEKAHAGAIATLAVSKRGSTRQLLFDSRGQLSGWENQKTGERLMCHNGEARGLDRYAFSGIAMVEPEMIALLPKADMPYPIVPEYIKIARGHRVGYYEHKAEEWLDVGKIEAIEQAKKMIEQTHPYHIKKEQR